jgi:hypothetical protein
MLMCTLTRIIGVSGSAATWLMGLKFSPDESRFAFLYGRIHEEDGCGLEQEDAPEAVGCVAIDEVFGVKSEIAGS